MRRTIHFMSVYMLVQISEKEQKGAPGDGYSKWWFYAQILWCGTTVYYVCVFEERMCVDGQKAFYGRCLYFMCGGNFINKKIAGYFTTYKYGG